jgi:GNAT superfamily N-acetyltransferase
MRNPFLRHGGCLLAILSLLYVETSPWQFRSETTANDVMFARSLLLRELMNPLSISQERLVVVFDEKSDAKPLLGFGQIRPLGEPSVADTRYSELASLFVRPGFRRQGIGKAIVIELLRRYDDQNREQLPSESAASALCLLTLRETSSFYEQFGFRETYIDGEAPATETPRSNLPLTLQLEYKAGSCIAKALGTELVCMVRPGVSTNL